MLKLADMGPLSRTYFVSNIDSESVITVPGQSKNIVETVKTVDKCNKSRLDLIAGTALL